MEAIQFNPTIPRYAIGKVFGHTFPRILWSGLSCTQYKDVPELSLLGDDWVKVKTRLGGICGTDLSTIRLHTSLSLTPFASFPNILGHEGVGTISEMGSAVHDLRIGDRVVVEPLLWCTPRGIADSCQFCQRGQISLCEHTGDGKLSPGMSIGSCRDTGGTWSQEFVAHYSQLYHVPDRISDKNALMVEPFSTALHSVLHNFPADGETVIILGAGTIGLCVLAALRDLGSKARLIVLARHNFQAQAAEKLGASTIISGSELHTFQEVAKSVGAKIKNTIMGKPVMVGGADRVFECTGSELSIANGLAMIRAGGRLILVGMPSTVKVDWTPISAKELSVVSSWAYHHAEEYEGRKQNTFDIALNLMDQGKVNLEWMVTHTFQLEQYKKAFEKVSRRGNNHVIKAAFVFD